MGELIRILAVPAVSGLLLVSNLAQASVSFPMLDIQTMAGDTSMTGDSSGLAIDASLIAQILDSNNNIADVTGPVFLSADFDNVMNGYAYHYTNGTITIGEPGQELLTAMFDDFVVNSYTGGYALFEADLTYTGGSLFTSAVDANGRLEGTVMGLTSNDLTTTFSSSNIIMKLGDVSPVPLPAAFWLFCAGLVSLAGIKSKKKRLL
jgi:hypothetical protein